MSQQPNPVAHPPNRSFGQVWFALAFRPFFLLAPIFSVFSLLIWVLTLNGQVYLNFYGGQLWWHMHEMLFGFSTAVIAGFLLTAVKNWTGLPGFSSRPLAGLVLLWLAARVSLLFSGQIPYVLIALIDLSFLPVVAIVLMKPIVQAKRWRNLIFLPILTAMTIANGLMHYAAIAQQPILAQQASYLMVMTVVTLMSIMAGRVFPMFTANGTRTQRVDNLPWLEKSSVTTLILSAIIVSFPQLLPSQLNTVILIVACVLNAWRGLRWRPQVTRRVALLWSLHLSYACIPLGLALFAISQWTLLVSQSQAIHSLTVGGIGLMILSMISRVSLGHTARLLVVGKWMAMAFFLVFLAFFTRVFGVFVWPNYLQVMTVSGIFWIVGYGLFVVHYWSVLTQPRVDGQPG